jgi:uncharacterized protein
MASLKWILAFAAAAYLGFTALMYFAQRGLMYFPDPARKSPAAYGLTNGEEVALTASDGERILAWHVPPQGDRPVVLYFQGNGGGLDLRAGRFRDLVADGTGLVAVNYRGYGGSTGKPTETGLLDDAATAYRFAAERYGAERIVLWGESLGTGVAVATAAKHKVARVVLESPFTSTADIAAATYFFLPVRLLMHDQFRSDERIGQVTAPVLVLHGVRDIIVPIRFGERLYALITSPKVFVRLSDADHNDHDEHGVLEKVRPFIAGTNVPS